MPSLVKKYEKLLEALFFGIIFAVSVRPLRDFDIWFHVKSGEIISKMGIIHHDVFSFAANGREWFPYEWLFQLTVYFFQQLFGFQNIKYLIAFVITLQLFFLYHLFRKVFNLNSLYSFALCFFFLASLFEFVTARPHVFAYTFLIFNLFIVLWYFIKSKNLLWATLPITLAWANLHGSIFVDVYLFGAYSFLSLLNYWFKKEKEWLQKFKTLGIFTFITGTLTILPPLDILQYRLLWTFFQNRGFISRFIDEWTPLGFHETGFIFFTTTTVIISIIFLFSIYKRNKGFFKKSLLDLSWTLPLLPFILLTYSASRNLYLGYLILTLMLGWSLSNFKISNLNKVLKYTTVVLIIVLVFIHGWFIYLKNSSLRFFYPINAVEFVKKYDLQGNMFNEYSYGGYLLYHLYPEKKVFFDGRTDVYLCCEMPDTMMMATEKTLPDNEYKKVLDAFWNKYNISYVLLRTEKHSSIRKIARVLGDDPNWSLVFWDDFTQIIVRKDGKNDDVINKFGAKAATPYNQNPYRKDQQDLALTEYQRMQQEVDSAKSRNTIGFIYLQKGKFEEARQEFEKAIQKDPYNESPFMNLAELAARDQDYTSAINLYKEAQKRAPDRGMIYIRLGQLFVEGFSDIESAKKIWEQGVKETVDDDAKKQLQNLLSKI